ncbi:uncharacterized protein Z518_04482 [Rhinocladiella mackenziei CBS 650.93]|uniref:ER transporter 6TM N-terminal domain-containing protein n=1 Tax=Rhinocladiella mackenziei CBS 650.93 TaxID=1442369 RepID=A0A0D2ITN7_9EURO|nr:uncharacterized protein Z518_04482 [Rhinocladiella mackenziei CBS 650.93]KIX06506.1 hypothetical protein Z518_04482 [Rhinocladiella mackenziei CBS 650.93]
MATQKGPSDLQKIMNKLGLKLNLPTLLLMFKEPGSQATEELLLPQSVSPCIHPFAQPTFSELTIARYQDAGVARHYSTIGYLIPIMSLFVVPILPRARFLQNFFVTCFLTCLAAAISLLYMWTAIKARQNTTHLSEERNNGPVPGAEIVPYNAAASACLAVWFFFVLWLYNTFRAYRPQYFLPLIVFSIFINITATYGCIFPTMEQAYSLTRFLLDTFFVGFGIAFAVHFVVLPITTRDLVTLMLNEYLHHLKVVFDAQGALIHSLPARDWGVVSGTSSLEGESDNSNPDERITPWPEADTWRTATAAATESQVKIHSEMRYVKREFAWSKLAATDFVCITKLLKNILVPVAGMETVIQVGDRVEKQGGWASMKPPKDGSSSGVSEPSMDEEEKERWGWFFDQIHEPYKQLERAMIDGLDYAFHTMGITKKPMFSTSPELEARGADSLDGKGFAKYLEGTIDNFLTEREGPLREWCRLNGMDDSKETSSRKLLHQRHRSQLYLILDLEYSVVTTAKGILDLVRFADSKVEDGTMRKKRLIVPTWKQLKKWAWALITREDGNLDYHTYSYRSGTPTVYLGNALGVERDPEHLLPETWFEKFTDYFRMIPKIFGSKESWFGFKVATGTMFIAIVCYLRNSQEFYIKQRLIWGAIMVAISMTQTAGSGMYGQFLRVFGTFLAMIFSYIDWYIVDGHTAGVIVFVGVTMFLYHYLMVTKPDDPVIPMIGMITVVLIVGYELQVKQVGIPISVSNGQVFHPVYELAPYRLACVLAGVGIACLLTYFPSVTTARSEMRKDLGNTMYLLGHYYSSTHKAVSLRLKGLEGDIRDKTSPIRKVEKARSRLFAKQLILIQAMKNHLKFIRWEPTFGGRFPRETYGRLLNHTQNILRFTGMVAHVTKTFEELPENTHRHPPVAEESMSETVKGTWLKEFKDLIASLELTSHDVTSLLAIISGAIVTGKPLPPYLKAPEHYHIGETLTRLDADILSVKHVCEPGYSAFAVMQVSTTMLAQDLADLLVETKKLVGEADFSLDVVEGDYEKRVGVNTVSATFRAKAD